MSGRRRRGRRAGGLLAAVVLGASLCLPSGLAASVRSESLYAKGLVPFHAERWEEAEKLFDAAVQLDAEDALALYYRGLARARLGRTAEAVADIDRAVRLRPELPNAALDLGILYFDMGQYDSAELWLQRAREEPANRFAASLFLGLTLYRQGRYEEAAGFLDDAGKDPEIGASARYYEALALQKLGRASEASVLFEDVATTWPETEVAQSARGAVPAMETMAPAAVEKRWSVHGDLGFAYDSNVVLAPDDSAIEDSRGIDEKSDGRAMIDVGGRYRVLETDYADATLSYDFHQSLHFSINDFDLQGHRLRGDVSSRPTRIQYGVSGLYDYYLLDFDSFYQQGMFVPWFTYFEGEVAATQAYYRFRVRDFLDDVFDPYRDGFNHAVGIRQFVLLGAVDRFVSVGYQFDHENPISSDGDDFQYSGHQIDARLHFAVRDWFAGTAGYAFRFEDYAHDNSRSGNPPRKARQDKQHQLVLHLERPLTDYLMLEAEYLGVIDDSNLDEFQYDRHIVSGGVRLHF